MAQANLIEKNKNKIISLVILIVALLISYNIFKKGNENINSIKSKITEEDKKSKELQSISQLSKKVSSYKQLLREQDNDAVINELTGLAKIAGVKVSSIKPNVEESKPDYKKSFFDVAINASSYNDLAKFISAVENSSNVYVVESMDINVQNISGNLTLAVNLSVSSVAATSR